MYQLNLKSNSPIYEQIVTEIKEMCAKGLLKPHEKLPSVRESSVQMLVNPNTVGKAYKELERQGIIYTMKGKGSFVSEHSSLEPTRHELENFDESLKKLIVEANFLQIDQEALQSKINQFYQSLEGQE
ncbi:GntR family transcriptional regulator [Listeria ilorinensis]|uniref:GntR family transcriptional regulator n=1 Tax=Listeria ilorinensis TaxID=2867439 RepID=UPI001EF63ACF|nr:GntR family transcriptional regulator [Listeria ilorinensis]